MKKFATALQTFAKTLAQNTGVKANEVISKLFAAHEEGKKNYGFDIDVRILRLCTLYYTNIHFGILVSDIFSLFIKCQSYFEGLICFVVQ